MKKPRHFTANCGLLRERKFLLLLCFLFVSLCGWAQEKSPIEKCYAQTDRPFYFPGETIWFKIHMANGENKPSSLSDVVVAELIAPRGSVVASKRLELTNGYGFGEFDIDKEWVGGRYKLRVYTRYMRNFPEDHFFTKELVVQKVLVPNLLMKLNFEREAYGKGSQVSANFKVEDLKNTPLSDWEATARVSISGKTYRMIPFNTDSNGTSIINFELPEDLKTSEVVLNLELPYKGAVESISRSVPIVMDNIDLQFLPEGGRSIKGSSNRVAFKALNEFGQPADVNGILLNAEQESVGFFESIHDGMGNFVLNGKSAGARFAKITYPFESDSLYRLPDIHDTGVKLSLISSDSTSTRWELFSSDKFKGKIQVLNSGGNVFCEEMIALKPGKNNWSVSTGDFPRGIAKFRLIDDHSVIYSERLVFLNNYKSLDIQISLEKEIYSPREEVSLQIETRDYLGNPVSSNLAVAITDKGLLTFADDKQDQIESYLLMSGELKGKIHEPSFYFDPQEPKASLALEQVMLTHGWRDYYVNGLDSIRFLPEKRNLIQGQIVDRKGDPTFAQLILLDRNGNKALEFATDKQGKFNCRIGNGRTYILIAYREDNKALRIINEVIPGEENEETTPVPDNAFIPNTLLQNIENPVAATRPNQKPVSVPAKISVSLEEDANALEEVIVTAQGIKREKKALGYAVTEIYDDELVGDASDLGEILSGKAAGVQVTQSAGVSGAGSLIQIRGYQSFSGSNEPLIIIDGIPFSAASGNNSMGNIADLNTNDIASVNVIKGVAAATLYGAQGANGVILISTRSGNYTYNNKVLLRKRYKNYAISTLYNSIRRRPINQSRFFYAPKYEAQEEPAERTDFRNTIYWNPVVQTDSLGQAKLSFHNSDAITAFDIRVSGTSHNGYISEGSASYSIQRPFTLQAKFPNYSSLNDTLNIPVNLTNNTEKAQKFKVSFDIPEAFEVLNKADFIDSLEVAANGFINKKLRLVPKSKGSALSVSLQAASQQYADGFEREMEITSPYFPTETSISGSQNGSYTFPINNIVPGSLKADFKVYLDVVGQTMNGIEGMLRQPYGCFEQTSSSTYPNVMILKYLKESGKNNREVEKRAMDFIRMGYKRLIGFETREGGFEWFGNTPPHQTLTAFGILEFIEMKEVYSGVDQKIIDRTIDWLLAQRDGKGGFHKSKKGYDSFASSPPEVANAYIVYALTEAGLQNDLSLEYEHAYQHALKTQDVYLMALMALASDNQGKTAAYQQLMHRIVEQIRENGFENLRVENTITRSYGNSKALETAAFSILALLRKSDNPALIAEGIKFLVSKRENGRFGSTQATVMCLKALIDYTRKQNQSFVASDKNLTLRINGKALKQDLAQSKNGILTFGHLGSYFPEGNQEVSVEFANPEHTFPYSMNIHWDSYLPDSASEAVIRLSTTLNSSAVGIGGLSHLEIEARNTQAQPHSMTTAIIGIPSGLSLQPYQLKELLETRKVDYYEVFGNYLVLYWKAFGTSEVKKISLDLKAEIPGKYTAPASCIFLYYGDEYKHWIPGIQLEISEQ